MSSEIAYIDYAATGLLQWQETHDPAKALARSNLTAVSLAWFELLMQLIMPRV